MKVKTKIRAGDVGETGTGAAQQGGNHNQTLVLDRKGASAMKVKTTVRAGQDGDTGTATGQQQHNQTLVRDRKSLRVKSGIKAGEDGTYQAQAGGS